MGKWAVKPVQSFGYLRDYRSGFRMNVAPLYLIRSLKFSAESATCCTPFLRSHHNTSRSQQRTNKIQNQKPTKPDPLKTFSVFFHFSCPNTVTSFKTQLLIPPLPPLTRLFLAIRVTAETRDKIRCVTRGLLSRRPVNVTTTGLK